MDINNIPHGDMPGDKIAIEQHHIQKAQKIYPVLKQMLRKQKPSLDTLLRISYALNLDINNILSDAPQLQSIALYRELEDLLDGCNGYEISVILQNAQALKNILKSAGRTSGV